MWGEKTGTMTNAERRCNLLQAAVPPPGEARTDLDIFIDVARRMNLRDQDGAPLIGYDTPEGAFDEWREISRGTIPDYSGMSYARLLERGLQWPCTDASPEGTVRLYETPRFPGTKENAELFARDLRTGQEHAPREYAARADGGGRARLIAVEYETPAEAPDAEYPMTALSGRQAYHWHTRTRTGRAPQLNDAAPEAFVAVNHADAARLGIGDGDPVRVSSRRGAVHAPAKVGDRVPPGVVFVPFHYGDLEGGTAANDLMPMHWDPASKQPVQKFAAVRLERVDGPARAWWRDDERREDERPGQARLPASQPGSMA